MTNFVVCNDGFLPIKIGSENKYGVAVINGTGTVICGIDAENFVQVGGFGVISGDDAGGSYFVRQVIKLVYCNLFRNRDNTVLKQYLLDFLSITEQQKTDFIELAINKIIADKKVHKSVIQKFFQAVNQGDIGAREILDYSIEETANGIIGCIKNLDLTQVEIILAGSVFVHCRCEYYFNQLTKKIQQGISQAFNLKLIKEVPAVGAVLWALELCQIDYAGLKNHVINEIQKYQF